MITAEDRLRSLLSANRSIVGELSLPAVLRRITDAAREVSGARYAALGVIGADGLLDEFVHSGMSAATVAEIGHLPRGRGVLGALLGPRGGLPTASGPIRLASIADDPRSSGFPAGHPPMRAFLGVPIRSRDQIFGNLYLTDPVDGSDFSAEDTELVLALAATAGIAIENAHLYEESRRRQEWLRASGEVSRNLLAPRDDDLQVLPRIAASMQRLADADAVVIVLPVGADPTSLEVAVAVGAGTSSLVGSQFLAQGSLAWEVIGTGAGLRLDAPVGSADPPFNHHLSGAQPIGPVMALPLTGETRPRGAVVLGRVCGRVGFAEGDLEMAHAFAGQAALALELADTRADQQRLLVLEDRDRIARDLHDHVIQRLFATGLSVQSAATGTAAGPLRDRLLRAVEDVDETIRQIRTSIFALRETHFTETSVRMVVLGVIAELKGALPGVPRTQFRGPIDAVVDDAVVDDVAAVLREALTNVAKHAHAANVTVSVAVADGEFTVDVVDDGVGLGPRATHSGLANLRSRAQQHGGTFSLANQTEGGLKLRWAIPLDI